MNIQRHIDREIEIETLAVAMAEQRIADDIERNGLTGTAGGKSLMKRAMQEAEAPFAEAIANWVATEQAKGRVRKSPAFKFLTVLSPTTLSYLTSRQVINCLARKSASYREVVDILAKEVLIATGAELFLMKDKKGFESLTRQLNWQSRTYIRQRMAEEVFRNECIEVDATVQEQLSIGTTLLEVFCDSTKLFEVKTVFTNRTNSTKELELTAKGEQWLKDAMEANRIAAPYHLPMVVKPIPWGGLTDGGYLMQNLHPTELVRTKTGKPHKMLLDADLSRVMKAVNTIQETPWTLNHAVLHVWRQLVGTGLAGCSSLEPITLPDAVAKDHPDFEQVNAARRDAHEEIKTNTARRCVEMQKKTMADIFESDERFYFPHNLDFRSRIYPLAGVGAINPQGDDSGKALIKFAEGKRLGEAGVAWLFIHTQNVLGNDKVNLQARIDATQANISLYCDYALNPLVNTGWMDADKPFCFLAACFEVLGVSMYGEDYVSHLPIALDGSCSGLQHFAGIMKDQRTAEAVNVVQIDGEKSSDIYTKVADGVTEMLADNQQELAGYWRDIVSRDLVKQPVMTLSYGVTLSGMRNQIREKCKKLVRKGKVEYKEGMAHEAASYLADCIHASIGSVAGAAFGVMSWLGEAAAAKAEVVKSLDGVLTWVTPMGFPVIQEYYEYNTERLNVFTEGRRLSFTMRQGPAVVKAGKQKQGAAPNFVHSMDASHLMLTVLASNDYGIENFAMIHDSFGTHAADTDALFHILRQEFADMYEQDVLLDMYNRMPEAVKAVLTPPPARGDLDLTKVLDSEFFFA